MQGNKPDGDKLYRRTRYYQSIIDGDLLDVGTDYDELNPCIIIFICPFDAFGKNRHVYTFCNYCEQDKDLELGDAATKMFLNTKGTVDDVTDDVKAFLDYVDGIISNDEFVKEIDAEIKEVKKIEQERVSYMTFAMKMMEERKEGRKEGLREKTVSIITNMLMERYPYAVISKLAETTEEEVIRIAKEKGLAYS